MKRTQQLLTINALAEMSGLARPLITERLRGVPPAGEARKNVPGWRLEDVLRPLIAAGDLQRERTRVAKIAGDRAELEFARVKGELLPADEVARADEAIWSALKDMLLAIPTGLADQICDVVKADGPAGIEGFLRERIEEVLTDASNAEFELHYADQG
jgi:phage terminase Nu1 subunit (DNA packaging protein)